MPCMHDLKVHPHVHIQGAGFGLRRFIIGAKMEKRFLKEKRGVMEKVLIRPAEAADYGSVEAIMKEVQQLHIDWRPDIYKAADPVYSREHFENLISRKQLLVAQEDGKVVGILTFLYRHVESDKQVTRDVLFVDDLAVKEEYRGRGIGTALLKTARQKVIDEKLDGLELQVNARNQGARRMYEKLGFTEKSINLELLF